MTSPASPRRLKRERSAGQALAISVSGLLSLPLACTVAEVVNETPAPSAYLEAAIEAGRWIASTAIETDRGTAWPDDALQPESVSAGIATGVAGKVLFFAALHEATGDDHWLRQMRLGADYLVATAPADAGERGATPSGVGLYGGLAGVATALDRAFAVTGEGEYLEGMFRSVRWIHQAAREGQAGAAWDERHDIMNGTAGVGAFLAYAAGALNHPDSLDLARRAADELIAVAIQEEGGLTWPISATNDMIVPNFSHGGAGIGFFLATLYQANGDPEYLRAAIASARYLESVATTRGDVFLVPYGWPLPEWEGLHDVGWAHGPAGTARLFFRLWQVTDDSRWLERVHAGARGIRESGIPGPPAAGFGEEPFKRDMRFGTAGVADFFLSMYEHGEDAADLDFARALIEDLLAASERDEDGRYWPMQRYPFFPEAGETAEFTGYFYGAAGYGLVLLHMDAAERGRAWTFRLPDSPF